MKNTSIGIFLIIMTLIASCRQTNMQTIGTYGYDLDFLKSNKIEIVELADSSAQSKVLIVPAYQGRVMTSTCEGNNGRSFGWINHKLIESGVKKPNFNPVGGEERFWLGPEGGPFSLYFKEGKEQVFENWKVPDQIDNESFDILSQNASQVVFFKEMILENASGFQFNIEVKRTISMLPVDSIEQILETQLGTSLKYVAYQTENTITNNGEQEWTKNTGLPSIWLLSMFTPSEATTVFIPYIDSAEGPIVNDEYFGKVPADRLKMTDGIIYFNVDGKYRSKIGVPYRRAMDFCGSYDHQNNVLTLLYYNRPSTEKSYVNGQWGLQDDPYSGDVINSYNDGPVDDGSIMGPFYELETSSPGAELMPNESLIHRQTVLHIQGNKLELDQLLQKVLGIKLETIVEQFKI